MIIISQTQTCIFHIVTVYKNHDCSILYLCPSAMLLSYNLQSHLSPLPPYAPPPPPPPPYIRRQKLPLKHPKGEDDLMAPISRPRSALVPMWYARYRYVPRNGQIQYTRAANQRAACLGMFQLRWESILGLFFLFSCS